MLVKRLSRGAPVRNQIVRFTLQLLLNHFCDDVETIFLVNQMNRFLRILQSCTAAQRVDRVPAIPIESAKPENGGLLLNSADSQLSSQHHLSAQAGKGLRNHILFSR